MFCPENIVASMEYNLENCKAYCKTNGATRLTYYNNGYCRCCTPASGISQSDDVEATVYTLEGNIKFSIHVTQLSNKNQ